MPNVLSQEHLNLSTTTIAPKPTNISNTEFSFEPISFASNNVSEANQLIQTTNGTSTHLSLYFETPKQRQNSLQKVRVFNLFLQNNKKTHISLCIHIQNTKT